MEDGTTTSRGHEGDVGSEQLRLLPIPIDSLDFRAHDLDMYLWHRETAEPALYRAAGTEFTAEDVSRLAAQNVGFLYVTAGQHAIYRKELTERLERQFLDPQQCRQERARIVRSACTQMIEDVQMFPGQPEPIAAIHEMAVKFTEWSESDPRTFSYMLDMSDHDYYTTTHMLNVGVGCGLLASRLRPDDPVFQERLYQGGMLHDVGKRAVPEEVLNKAGKLSEEEWDVMRRHPALGFEELAGAGVPQEVLEMARDHHERLDGTGYPAARPGQEIQLPARICAVVDVFDSLTAARPYRGPVPPQNALKIMEEGVGTQFDGVVFEAWRTLVEELIREDPARASPAAPQSRFGRLQSYAQQVGQPPDEQSNCDNYAGSHQDGNRREFERFSVSTRVQLEFSLQLKPYPVRVGQRFDASSIDISRGGMQVRTPWPLAINDMLIVHLTTPQGVVRWRARVARVRAVGKGWAAGLQFLAKVVPGDAAA